MGDNSKLNMQLVNVVNDEKSSFEAKEKKVKYLLFLGADVETRANTTDNKSLLCMMIEKGDEKMAQLLIKSGADATKKEVFYEARKQGGKVFEIIKEVLVQEFSKNLDGVMAGLEVENFSKIKNKEYSKEDLNSELWNLVKADHVKRSNDLIDMGADTRAPEYVSEVRYCVDEPSYEYDSGHTLLTYACENGQKEMAEMLIEKGLGVNEVSYGICASQHGNEDMESPLYCACHSGNVELVKMLIDKGAELYKGVEHGKYDGNRTPLNIALEDGRIEVVKVLLEKGADLEMMDEDNPPMYSAIWSGKKEMVEFLLERGVEVLANDVEFAKRRDFVEIAEILENARKKQKEEFLSEVNNMVSQNNGR